MSRQLNTVKQLVNDNKRVCSFDKCSHLFPHLFPCLWVNVHIQLFLRRQSSSVKFSCVMFCRLESMTAQYILLIHSFIPLFWFEVPKLQINTGSSCAVTPTAALAVFWFYINTRLTTCVLKVFRVEYSVISYLHFFFVIVPQLVLVSSSTVFIICTCTQQLLMFF